MVDEVVLKKATETAWTVYRARHPDVDAHDSRRSCWSATSTASPKRGGAYRRTRWLRDSLPAAACWRRMLTAMKMLAARVARGSTRPAWTLLAISFLMSAVVVLVLRFVSGA